MDTHGHEEVSEVGRKLLQRALDSAGKGGWSLQSFYLGNWITDVCQGVDPVAYDSARDGMLGAWDGAIASVRHLVSTIRESFVGGLLRGPLNELEMRLQAMRDELEAHLAVLTGGRESDFGKFLTKAMKVKGYFKFAHPEKRGGKPRMKYSVYKRVFTDRFTQYYPHEHLDRFPNRFDKASGYSAAVADGTRTEDGVGTGARLDPHLYGYLVDDIEIAAGLLAEVDLQWARTTFRDCSGPWPDANDEDWNLWLAKLGHAIHACEDFFAHSSFIEHALQGMSDSEGYLKKLGFDPKDTSLSSPWTLFQRRLKRMAGRAKDGEWVWDDEDKLADDPHVVTGFFDFVDTYHSLKHVVAEIFGGDGHGPEKAVERGIHYTKLMRALSEGVKKRSEGRGDTTLSEADARRDAEAVLKELLRHHDAEVRDAAQAVEDLPADAKEIRGDLLDAIALVMKHSSPSIYDGVLFVLEYQSWLLGVKKWIRDLVPEIDLIPEPVKKWWRDTVGEPLDRLIDTLTFRYRPGSHSLLAKDYAWEHPVLDEIYARAKNCARALHWYVLKTIARWSRKTELVVCRVAHDESSRGVTADSSGAIDWLELLETFLRHPFGNASGGPAIEEKDRWWWPVVRGSWTDFPGYDGESIERLSSLPHRLVPLENRAKSKEQADCAREMRGEAEAFYDQSGSWGAPPPSHRGHTVSGSPPPSAGGDEDQAPSVGRVPVPAAYLSTHDDVRLLQEYLTQLGHDPGKVDGHWGPKTRAAVERFQRANPPLEVDGIFGPNTRAKLDAVVNG